jgi:hypothetical protein
MDATAMEDCQEILALLQDAGVEAVLLDDSAPGVPEGVFEVRVAAAETARAEKLIAENPLLDEDETEAEELDPSSELDLETIASAATELEATTIKNLLDASGIAAVLVGDSVLPNFAFDVRVAHDQAARARQIVEEAQRGGPAAALRGELESES